MDLSPDARDQVMDAIAGDRKIEAIRLYRAATGAGLRDAKEAVEAMATGVPIAEAPTPRDLPDTIPAALFAGQKITAIKLYRDATGSGLRTAKEAVEAMEADLRRTSPRQFAHPPGPTASSSGPRVLAVLMLVVIASATLLIWWLKHR